MGGGKGIYVNGDGYEWEWAREYMSMEAVMGGGGDRSIREWRRLWVVVGKGVNVNGDGYGWGWAREYT